MIGTGEHRNAIELPESAVTEGFGLLARRRSGKSNLAGVIEETFCERGDPWVVLDPVAAHWGIRYQDDHGQPGKPSGYDVLIVGGKYGDVALDERGGGALAQILVDTGISCVVDLSAETMNAQQKFVADFASELLRINETPRHVLLEEAHTFVPQVPTFDNQKAVLGALTKMITMGGGKGIGFTLITQRSASIAKAVLEQIDNLFVLRMSGPRDLKAVQDWFEHNIGDAAEMKRMLGTLRSFQPGEAWWLSDTSLERLTVRLRRTYHAGRTPKRGETMVAPKRVELGEVIGQYKKAAEKRAIAVQEERDLKAENAALRKQLAAKAPAVVACNHEREIAELKSIIDSKCEHLGVAETRLLSIVELARDSAVLSERIAETANYLAPRTPVRAASKRGPARAEDGTESTSAAAPVKQIARSQPVRPPSQNGRAPSEIKAPMQRILDALASFSALAVESVPRQLVAVWSSQSPKSSSYDANLQRLREAELIAYTGKGPVSITAGGMMHAAAQTTPTRDDLIARWCALVTPKQGAIIRALVAAHPDAVDRTDLADATDQSWKSSSYDANLQTLRSFGVAAYTGKGPVVATSLLFPRGLP